MGMFDKPRYLTGKEGYVSVGETFYLHNARMEGTVNVNGQERPQAKLQVSRTEDDEREVVFTSGAGIVAQIQRMDSSDFQTMRSGGMHVRLDEVPSQRGNPTNVLTPADQPPASESRSADFDAPADF